MRKIGAFLFALVCILLYNVCNTRDDEQLNGNGGNVFDSVTVSGITLQWHADTLGFLHIKLSAPTTGWIAVGFDPSQGMLDANIIIDYVHSDTAYLRDDYGTGINTHEPDINSGGENNINESAGSEIDGITTLEFTIPLDSGDSRDRPLIIGNTYAVILAYGNDDADDFDSYHQERTATQIDI